MTRTSNARIAGVAYLFYTAVGLANEILLSRAKNAVDNAGILARIGEHATDVRISILLRLLESLSALVLAVALYGITRNEDHELAMLAMLSRVAEGVIGALAIPRYVELLWLAQARVGTSASDVVTANALREFLLMPGPSVPTNAIFFALGSLIFSFLLLRGRMVPRSIALLGVFTCALLVVTLPLQLAGFSTGPLTGYYQWVPALVFQLALSLWFLAKGVV